MTNDENKQNIQWNDNGISMIIADLELSGHPSIMCSSLIAKIVHQSEN